MITPSFGLTATERVLPRLALDFTTASLDPRVTFTRAGNTATVVNSSGNIAAVNANIPRFDYDSITLACKGLLIEESRTNLLLQSQAIDQAVWVKTNINTTGTPPYIDVATSPDGTQNADLVIPNTTLTASHKINQASATVAAGATVTSSIYLKPSGYNFVLLRSSNASEGTAFQVLVNLSNGTIGTPSAYGAGASVAGATITLLKNGWYRVTLTGAITGLLAYEQNIYVYESGPSAFSGNGTSGVYMWGAQVEVGAFATSYIPTVASQVTRTADLATMTGTNFSSWFNASQGSFTFTGNTLATGAVRPGVWINKTAGGNGYIQFKVPLPPGTTGITIQDDAGAVVADLSGTSITLNTAFTVCGGYKANDFGFADRGAATAVDTSGAVPTGLDRMGLGWDFGTNYQNGHIAAIRYWPQKLTTAEIQAFSKQGL